MNLNRSEKYFRNKQQGVSLKVRTYNLLNTDTDTRSHVFFCRRRVERESSRSDIDGMHTVGSNTPALSSFTTLVSTRRGGYDVPRVENARTGEVRTIHPNPTSMISAITLAHVHKYIRSIYSSIPSLSKRRSKPQELHSFVDRGVTRYERVTRYILQHEEADSRVRKRLWSSRNSVGLLAREAKQYRFSSSFPSSRCLALSFIFHRHMEEESLR